MISRSWTIWPRNRFWLVLAAVVAASTIAVTSPVYGWGPAQWRELVSAAREGTMLTGLLIATVTAQLARPLSRRSVVAGPSVAGAERPVGGHLIAIGIAVSSGYVTGLVPPVLFTTIDADAGGPDVLALLSVLPALIATGYISYALSAALATRWARILVPAVTFGVIMLPPVLNETLGGSGRSTRLPSLVWLNDYPLLGWHITSVTSLFRLVFFTLVVVAAAMTVMDVARRRSRLPVGPGAVCMISVTVATVGVISSPHLVQPSPAPAECVHDDPMTICVHPSYRSLMGPAIDIGTTTADLIPEERLPPGLQQPGTEPGHGDYLPADIQQARSEADLQHAIVTPMATFASGSLHCAEELAQYPPGEDPPQELEAAYGRHHAVHLSIEERSGITVDTGQSLEATGEQIRSEELDAIATLSDDQFHQWLADHASELSTCTLRDRDLP